MAKAPSNTPEQKNSATKVIGQKVSLGYAWYALFILFLVNFLNYVDRMSINTAMETLKRYFEINDFKLGMIASSFTIMYALISMPMGFLSDRGVRTRIIAAGIFVWSIATTFSGFMMRFWPFFLSRAAVGSGEGIYAPSGNAIVVDYFPKRLRNTVISIFMSAMILGGAVSFIVAGLILTKTEHFDKARVEKLVAAGSPDTAPGWTFVKDYETKKRHIAFEFKSAAGETFSVVLKKHEDKKKEDDKKPEYDVKGSSKLFDIYYVKDGNSTGAQLNPDEISLLSVITARVITHESDSLQNNRFDLKVFPSNVKIPDKFKDRLSYDEKGKQLVFKGVMTLDEKKELMKLTENEQFNKAVGFLYSDSTYYFIKSDNWKWIFWIMGPPGLLVALLCFFLREPLKGGNEDFISEEEARTVDKADSTKSNYKVIFTTPSIVIMIISGILVTYCTGGLVTWLFPFVERWKNIPSAEASMKFGPYVVGSMVLGVIISGVVADKLAKKTPYGNNIILVLSILFATPFLFMFLNATSEKALLTSISCGMFFLSWINGPQNALLMSLVEPKIRATFNAFNILLIHMLGDALSPMVIGKISDIRGLKFALSVTLIFLVAGMIGFAVAGKFVPADLKAMEDRMKSVAA